MTGATPPMTGATPPVTGATPPVTDAGLGQRFFPPPLPMVETDFQLRITVFSVLGHLREFFGNFKVFQRNYRYERGSKVGVKKR